MATLSKHLGFKVTNPKKFDSVADHIRQAEQDLAAEKLREMQRKAEQEKRSR